MPKRDDIHTILLIGSGAIVIGQACEFDYSGTQAVKTLKSLGYKVVLINSNPATIMTDPDFADATYIEPINEEIIADIIKKEKIDAILPTMGGQTALNVAMSMHEKGMLKNVEFLGAKPEAIKKGEDRQAFKEAMIKIGMDLPKSAYAYNEEEALNAAQTIGFPLIIRASYTLAGGGSGVAYNIDEFKILAKNGLEASPINEILIEESLLGWKEFEMEVIRDKNDNCIIVCSIENLDPMGVHTGDSITIAPALTLTDKEYQRMRDASFKILREIGVDTGGSNVQFAINPQNGRMTVIEMNPRVSRSSALASKATGYPIAKVATMLAVGFTLDEITNDITGTPASFEPSIDYIVTKIPRFTFEKFPMADSTLSTSMKSIGEVMAIGGTFKESLQKALCSLEIGLFGFNRICTDLDMIKREIRRPNAARLLYIAEGFGLGMNVDSIYELCKIDKWFLNEIKEIIESENLITSEILRNPALMRKIKSQGYSDKNIAYWLNENENLEISESEIYQTRLSLGVVAKYLEVDTCSAEFPSLTSYLYSSIGDFEEIDSKFIESKYIENSRSEKSQESIGIQNLDSKDSQMKVNTQSVVGGFGGLQGGIRGSDFAIQATLVPPCERLDCKDPMSTKNIIESSEFVNSRSEIKNMDNKIGFKDSIESNNLQNLDSKNQTTAHHPSILIIGGGPNRIGQGIEFDYCCVHASFALKDLGIKSIMYNCNPETVSTDYDTSDTLYFEPIDFEHVRAVIERENPSGIIVHFGGQTPLKLANSLSKINAKIIGTSAKVIDIAEDREKFAKFINKLGLKQPQNGIAFDKQQAYDIANNIGFPVLVRPSYVLGGRAMRIVYDNEELKLYMDEVLRVSENSPVLIDKFLESALELDVDCVSDGSSVYIGGIMEHIEEAGIHSGDSASVLPSLHISAAMIDEIESTTAKIALELGVIGLMNVQYAIYKDSLYLIEVNPRASRTVPFVSKATGIPLAKVATRVMYHSSSFGRFCGSSSASHCDARDSASHSPQTSQPTKSTQNTRMLSTKDVNQDSKNIESILLEALRFYDKYNVITQKDSRIYTHKHLNYSNVKESVFPFNKLPGADLLLGPEMKSTGEVMGMSDLFGISFAKSQIACKNTLPLQGNVLLSLADKDKQHLPSIAKKIIELGFKIYATSGTYATLIQNNIEATKVLKISEGRPNINDMLANKQIDMVINTSDNKSSKDDARQIRVQVIRLSIPYFTTISGTKGALEALKEVKKYSPYKAKSLQDYLEQ